MSGVSIQYGDIAPGAKENFDIVASESKFGDKYKENLKKYNMQLYNYAQPCEMYQTVLDGTAVAFPSNPNNANIGLWSNQLSGSNGEFATPIQITLTSAGQYSSKGFTFIFDKFNNIYPTNLQIQWFRVTDEGTTDLGTKTFTPNSGFYFCQNAIENFNKVIITFTSINMPYNRLKLEQIDYGYGTVFYGDELRNVKISQSLNPISSEIAINTCDFTLDSKSEMNYSFQEKQPLTVRFNDQLRASMFVKNSKRTGKFLWEVNSEDYIGMLDRITFPGGLYTNKSAGALFETIFKTANVPYNIDDSFYNVILNGYLPYATCREALQQVAFASQAAIITSDSDVVNVTTLSDTETQKVTRDRIMQGQSFEDSEGATGVEITSYKYTPISATVEAYKAENSGVGDNILVKFSEPLHDLKIGVNLGDGFTESKDGGIIVKSDTNYAIINVKAGGILIGQKYDVTTRIKRKTNPLILSDEAEKISSITSATLISDTNVDSVLEKCYNWLIKKKSINVNIVEGKHDVYTPGAIWGVNKWGTFKWGQKETSTTTYDKVVNIGDVISVETEYLGDLSGRVISQSFNLNGNILVKEVVLK